MSDIANRKRPPTEAPSRNERAASAPQQKDYNNYHQYRAEAPAIIMEGRAHIETAAAEKENQNNQE